MRWGGLWRGIYLNMYIDVGLGFDLFQYCALRTKDNDLDLAIDDIDGEVEVRN